MESFQIIFCNQCQIYLLGLIVHENNEFCEKLLFSFPELQYDNSSIPSSGDGATRRVNSRLYSEYGLFDKLF
jgi:hypothetical protein